MNAACRLVYSGLNEILGCAELEKLTEVPARGADFECSSDGHGIMESTGDMYLRRMQTLLGTKYGDQELSGLMLRSGRASCKFFVRQYGPEMQVTSTDFRLLPTKKKLQKGLKAAAGLCGELFRKEISVIDQDDRWIWQEKLPASEAEKEDCRRDSLFTIGLLQEFLAWLSGGKTFQVKRTETAGSMGDVLCLSIHKKPME
jgi:hypothetical protein